MISMLRDAWTLAPEAMTGGLLVAAACAVVGLVLRWRRLVWTGLAVPEASNAGTAFALGVCGIEEGSSGLALLASVLAIVWLVPVGRSGGRTGESSAAACFLLASTLSVLFVSNSPHGLDEVRALATGRGLLFLREGDMAVLAATLGSLLAVTLIACGALSAAAFDRDHARMAGFAVARLEGGFAIGFALLVSVAGPRAGAPFLFAYLTLAPAAAESLAARPSTMLAVSVLLAAMGFLLGGACAVRFDLPFSTAASGGIVAVAGLCLAVGRAVGRVRHQA